MNKFSCYLCSGNEYIRRDGCVRDKPELEIWQCTTCGLVCLSTFEHISEAVYKTSAMHANQPVSEYVSNRQELDDLARRFRDFSPYIIGKRLLDFGCGNGKFLSLCKPLASEVYGIELDKRWYPQFNKFDIIVAPTLDKLHHESDFDVVTMLHVLEHLPDPLTILKKIHSRIHKSSLLIIEVPNADDALLTLYKCKSFSAFTYWSFHLFYYTSQTLRQLLEKAGFKNVTTMQVQRYSLTNHLYWLTEGKPGGHIHWDFLNDSILTESYNARLSNLGMCDTIIGFFQKI
jgi:methionine biosynthesis protein metW